MSEAIALAGALLSLVGALLFLAASIGLIVTNVLIERLDNPVSPAPDMFGAASHLIVDLARPVRIAPYVHPVAAPPLAVLRTGQQSVNNVLVCVWRIIGKKLVELQRGWRQPDQIYIRSTQ